MRALTLTQPWAQLMADGRKTNETRSWWPPRSLLQPGATFAIHAGKGWTADYRRMAKAWGYEVESLPRGAIIALACLKEAVPAHRAGATGLELAYGDYSPGRCAWKTEHVTKLSVPVPCRGALGLWEIPEDVLEQLEAIARMDDGGFI